MKAIILLLISCICFLSCTPTINDPGEPILFTDTVLEARLIELMGSEPITTTAALRITKLELSSYGLPADQKIKNLQGLEYFTELTELDVSVNDINDLSPLEGLTKLEILDCYDNSVSDLTPIRDLVKLNDINFWANNLGDISVLAGLPLLTKINIGANSAITSIEPIKNLTDLNTVWLNFCSGIQDLSLIEDFLAANKIERLALMSCGVTDLDFLVHYPQLKDLMISHNSGVTSLTSLSSLTKLRALSASNCSIEDFTILDTLLANGCFIEQSPYTFSIYITDNDADVRTGTANRTTIEEIITRNIKIDWQTGNTVD